MAGSILSPRHMPVLAGFAASNVLLAFDYDGTLAPIAPTPASARMRAETRRWLARAARRYPCVVISGRTLDDLSKRLSRVPVWYLFGNHGFEPSAGNEGHAARVRAWADSLSRRLPVHQGLVIEQKKYSLTVHYRHVRDKHRVVEAIVDAVRHLPDVRAIGGAEAINLLPLGGPNKGVALQEARRLFACDTAIYIGDDDTDEDAFASAPPDRLLSIRVGTRRQSRARYRLPHQRDVDTLLQRLVELRATRRA
ncbi:MAG: trehalose-phosphatase [Acidobacteria bacterium]|nr:trehalose-phosphatase [Acidobacteriota bacterium]